MKKIITSIALMLSIGLTAQSSKVWTHDFGGAVKWHKVTSLGNYIVNTSSGLSNLNTGTGDVVWVKPELASITEGAFVELDNSPFAKIQNGNDLFFLNLFDGTKVFSSKDNGIAEVSSHYILYQSNTIVVAGKDAGGKNVALSVDIATGKVLWRSEKDFGKLFDVVEINENELLGITLFKNIRIKSKTGDIVWEAMNSEEAKQMSKLGGFGNMLGQMAEGMVDESDLNLDFSFDPSGKYFVVGSQQESQSSMSSSSSSQTVSYECKYAGFDLATGDLLWKSPIKVKGKLGYMTWLDGNLLILPNGANSSKVNLFDITTAQGLWGKKGKGVSIKGGIYSYTETDNGMLVITTRNGKNFLSYLDTKNGVFTFDKAIKVKGYVGYTLTTSKGVYYATEEEMNFVDIASGELLWDKDLKTNYNLVQNTDKVIYALDSKTSLLKGFSIADGSQVMTSKEAVSFQEGEYPSAFELKDSGIVLSASQNVAKFDYEGNLIFNNYFPAPKEAGWKRAFMYASAIQASYVAAVSGVASASLHGASSEVGSNTADGQIYSEFGNAYGDLSQQATGVAADAFKAANKRFKATKSSKDEMIVLTKLNDEITLVKVSKDTGEVLSKISLGKNREPNYSIDLVEGKLFLKEESSSISGYKI